MTVADVSTSRTASSLTGRVALVTGASSGIGRAIARTLACDEGMRVVAVARRRDRLEALADEVARHDGPGEVVARELDLRDTDAIVELFDEVCATLGGVDVLVNNAGLGHDAPLVSGETEAWREMLEVNVLALCVCTREAVADMERRGVAGHVVHVSSMSGHRVPGGSGVYSATKFAVRSLTEGLRQELRARDSNIRVGAVSPGVVDTEFGGPGGMERPWPVLESEDIAEAVRYMLTAPPHVQVHDLLVRPTRQPL